MAFVASLAADGHDGRRVPPRASLVTVTYNSAAFIEPFCAAVAALPPDGLEVIVVDNASRDDTVARVRRVLPGATLIESARNLGFAGGSNLGVARATGDVLVFLNPDTRPPADALAGLVRPVWERPDVGAVGCKLLFPDGRIQSAGGVIRDDGFCTHRGYGRADDGAFDAEASVDYVPGAALAIRRDLFLEVGGFYDGYFPGFYEDVELCLRVRRSGRRVLYVPRPVIVHLEGTSTGATAGYTVHRNRVLFLARNADPGHPHRALVREASHIYRTRVRPLLVELAHGRGTRARALWNDWRPSVAGELAGFVVAARLVRRDARS